jgi:hypothetical protein
MMAVRFVPPLRWIQDLRAAWTYIKRNPYEPRLRVLDAFRALAESPRSRNTSTKNAERPDGSGAQGKFGEPWPIQPGAPLREGLKVYRFKIL